MISLRDVDCLKLDSSDWVVFSYLGCGFCRRRFMVVLLAFVCLPSAFPLILLTPSFFLFFPHLHSKFQLLNTVQSIGYNVKCQYLTVTTKSGSLDPCTSSMLIRLFQLGEEKKSKSGWTLLLNLHMVQIRVKTKSCLFNFVFPTGSPSSPVSFPLEPVSWGSFVISAPPPREEILGSGRIEEGRCKSRGRRRRRRKGRKMGGVEGGSWGGCHW